MMLDHCEQEQRVNVLLAMQHALDTWLAYRDEVAEVCGAGAKAA